MHAEPYLDVQDTTRASAHRRRSGGRVGGPVRGQQHAQPSATVPSDGFTGSSGAALPWTDGSRSACAYAAAACDGGRTLDGTLVLDSLLSAPVLAFVLAVAAGLARFEVRLPEALPPVLATFLLFAIGLKGGRSLSEVAPTELAGPLLAALVIGVVTPIVAFALMRAIVRLGRTDAAGVAAHYGSVSAVTFIVALTVVEAQGIPAEGLLAGLLAVLEVVGIVVGLALASRGRDGARGSSWARTLSEIVRGRSITMLLLGIAVGLLAGDARLVPVDPLFVGLFQGALVLFLLEMGAIAAERLRDVARLGPRLIVAAIVVPIANGAIGALLGALAGLSTGGVAVLATLAASASYIAAPAAVRIALPEADPAVSITASLGITFPFNLTVGIPLFVWFATLVT